MNLQLEASTVLTALTLTGILWLVRTVSAIEKRQAVNLVQEEHRELAMVQLRARITTLEADVQVIKMAVAVFSNDKANLLAEASR